MGRGCVLVVGECFLLARGILLEDLQGKHCSEMKERALSEFAGLEVA